MKAENKNRKIAIPNFFGEGKHAYEDQIGWFEGDRKEARSNVSREVFEYNMRIGRNLTFYFIDNDTFYEFFGELQHVVLAKPPRDMSEEYTGWQCDEGSDFPSECEIVQSYDSYKDIWNNTIIDGKTLDYVLDHSYIVELY